MVKLYKWAKREKFYLLQPVAETREREGEREVGGEQVPVKDSIMIENCPTSLMLQSGQLEKFCTLQVTYLLLNSLLTARFTEDNMGNLDLAT